jgi:hypothetical protein
MNLDEFRKAMESDATIENERLKRDLADVEKSYRDMLEGYTVRIQRLNSDCRALANRCFALTHGEMCVFCELSDYRCKHAMSIDDKVKAAKKLMEETSNA